MSSQHECLFFYSYIGYQTITFFKLLLPWKKARFKELKAFRTSKTCFKTTKPVQTAQTSQSLNYSNYVKVKLRDFNF